MPTPPDGAAEQGLVPGSRAWLLSTYATDADVLAAVSGATHALPLAEIAWRARRSADFHRRLLAALRAAGQYDDYIWSLALWHGDHDGILEWLAGSHSGLTQFVGAPFHCGKAHVRPPCPAIRHVKAHLSGRPLDC